VNVRIPTYWFWFAIFFGIINFGGFVFGTECLLRGNYSTVSVFNRILAIHTTAATALGVLATVTCHVRSKSKGEAKHRVYTTYSTRGLLASMAIFAIAFGVLSWAKASPVVFVCVLIAAAGQPCTAVLVHWWARGTRRS
jgi:hypothetical protein